MLPYMFCEYVRDLQNVETAKPTALNKIGFSCICFFHIYFVSK